MSRFVVVLFYSRQAASFFRPQRKAKSPAMLLCLLAENRESKKDQQRRQGELIGYYKPVMLHACRI